MTPRPCQVCGADLTPDRVSLGICKACTSPERLYEKAQTLPEPLRGVFLRVGERMGLFDERDALGRTKFLKVREDGFLSTDTPPGQQVCDFCLAPDPPWEYPAGWMKIEGNADITNSDDEWCACQVCHDLIEADDIDGLVERMVVEQRKQPVTPTYTLPPIAVMYDHARTNVKRFMDARTGPARPFTP